jgi:hypothetical protein
VAASEDKRKPDTRMTHDPGKPKASPAAKLAQGKPKASPKTRNHPKTVARGLAPPRSGRVAKP